MYTDHPKKDRNGKSPLQIQSKLRRSIWGPLYVFHCFPLYSLAFHEDLPRCFRGPCNPRNADSARKTQDLTGDCPLRQQSWLVAVIKTVTLSLSTQTDLQRPSSRVPTTESRCLVLPAPQRATSSKPSAPQEGPGSKDRDAPPHPNMPPCTMTSTTEMHRQHLQERLFCRRDRGSSQRAA